MLIDPISARDKTWKFCVVGTGPVGMTLALELERLGHEVLLLESGGAELDKSLETASHAEIADPDRHAPMEIAVCRALGGTSWTWGGRCVAYDDVDWMDREFVPEGRWPLSHEEIRPWYKRAAEVLLCGSDVFELPYERTLTDGLTLDFIERWARESKVILAHREHLLRSKRVQICLRATVTGLKFSAHSGRVESLTIAGAGSGFQLRARHIVLAMGGVETTRFLLHVQQSRPEKFGGVDGPLGRYYMGHLSGKIASIVFNDPKTSADLDFKLDSTGAWIRRRFMLTTETQLKHRVLNTAFWPDNPAFYDPSHKSGVLSGVFLALAFPPTGRRLLSEAIRLAHTGPRPYKVGAHLKNAILGAPRAAGDVCRILRDRFLRKPRKPGFLVPNRGGRYALHFHAEQVPQAESRITLTNESDEFGVKRAAIDLRFCAQDVESVVASHKLLDKALRANGIGRLEYLDPPDQFAERVFAQASDGFHQVGTTRMGDDPSTSVVDCGLRVHGVDNLFVASSSVFPTSGQANSTMLAAAFAARLAHHLHDATVAAGEPSNASADAASQVTSQRS